MMSGLIVYLIAGVLWGLFVVRVNLWRVYGRGLVGWCGFLVGVVFGVVFWPVVLLLFVVFPRRW